MLKARQVPFDEQQSPFYDDYEELIYIAFDGNTDYRSRYSDEYSQVKYFLANCLPFADNFKENEIEEIVNENLDARGVLPLDKTKEIWEVLKKYDYTLISYSKAVVDILSIWTDSPWEYCTIRGCSHGEWQNVYYDTAYYPPKDIERIQMDYFNLGTQWEVLDEDGDEYYNVYCYSYNDNDLKKEIANSIGKDVSEISFEKFVDYKRVPVFEEF